MVLGPSGSDTPASGCPFQIACDVGFLWLWLRDIDGKKRKTDEEKMRRGNISEGEIWKRTRIKKSHFPIMSFSQNIELSSVNGRGPAGSGGHWLQRCRNERVCCLMLGEGDERGEGDGEFVGHRSPLPSPPHPAALHCSAHVSKSSNAGPAAACAPTHTCTDTHPHTHTDHLISRSEKKRLYLVFM